MTPKLRVVAFSLGLASLLPALSSAQNVLPHRKAGMWETTMQVAGRNIVMGMCTDEGVEARFSAVNPQQMGARDCTGMNPVPIPGGYRMEGTCNISGRSTHTVAMVTGDFRSGYAVDVTSETAGKASPPVHMDAKWTGPCPADRKPGDMVMPGGIVMNVANMPGMR